MYEKILVMQHGDFACKSCFLKIQHIRHGPSCVCQLYAVTYITHVSCFHVQLKAMYVKEAVLSDQGRTRGEGEAKIAFSVAERDVDPEEQRN